MTRSKKVLYLLLCAAFILVLGACSTGTGTPATATTAGGASAAPATSAATSAPTAPAELPTIRIGRSTGNIRVAILTLADELGFYEEEGVNVEFVEISDAAAAISAISLNKDEIDVVQTSGAAALSYIAQGTNVSVIGGIASEGGAMITKPENAEYYADLKNVSGGITVAAQMSDTGYLVTRAHLEELGVDTENDIKYLFLASAQNIVEAVVKGEAQVGFTNAEAAYKYQPLGIEIVYEIGEIVPDYVCCRQISSNEKIAAKRDAFVNKAVAEIRALKYYDENHAESVDILAAQSGQDKDYVENYIYKVTKYTLDPNIEGINTLFGALLSGGYIDGVVKTELDGSIDISIYKDALDIILSRSPDDAFYKALAAQFEANNS